jgi:helicase
LEKWVLDLFAKWTLEIFNCNCKDNPFCECGQVALAKKIVELRFQGLRPSQISQILNEEYELYVYAGDIFGYLNDLIHRLRAISRIAETLKKEMLIKQIQEIINKVEKPNKNQNYDTALISG